MEQKVYLGHYRVCLDDNGSPVELVSGTGTVSYKAEDATTGRDVIVQVVPVASLRPPVRERLEAEALAAKQINHLNIPALSDFGFAGDELVYVTEYFDGTSAQAWVTEHGPMPIGAVLRIAAQMVGAVGAASFHGIAHHALNPGNVMLVPGQTPEGDWPLIKVVNFLGLAPRFSTAGSSGTGIYGPENYASPEQLQDGVVDFRSEIYSLGCTLWFLLTGVPPFAGAVTVTSAPGVPGAVKELIGQMLAQDPGERQLDPLALQEQIENCIAQVERRDAMASKVGMAPAASPVTPEVIPGSARRPLPRKLLALAALLLIAVALAALALPRSLRPSRLFTRAPAPIGVPIGIPETPPAPATSGTGLVSAPTSPDAPNNISATRNPESPRVVDRMQEVARMNGEIDRLHDKIREIDHVLTSTASADDPPPSSEDSERVAESSVPDDVPAPVAAETAAEQDAPMVAANIPVTAPAVEPPPPSEGPAELSAPPSSQEVISPAEGAGNIAGQGSAATSLESQPAREPAAPAIERSARPKSASVAKTTKPSNRTSRSKGLPPPPRSVRAQYLGTTPDGELVFGLPSSERVYLAPTAGRAEPPRRRGRRGIRDPIADLPVLRALPPDE